MDTWEIGRKNSAAERCVDALIHYTAERQAGFEKHQGGGILPNPKARSNRTRELIRGMAGLYGLDAECCTERLDEQLRTARSCVGVEMLSTADQQNMVKQLLHYVSDLAIQPQDNREQMLLVSDHFEDMAACLSWDVDSSKLNPARDWLNRKLSALTAQQDILFTRILLGAERGPVSSDFVGGAVTDAAGVADTYLFDDLSEQYPEIDAWPALCTVYRGGYGHGEVRNATEMDLGIMRRRGDSFVELEGIVVCSYPTEITITKDQQQKTGGVDMRL